MPVKNYAKVNKRARAITFDPEQIVVEKKEAEPQSNAS